MSAYAYQEEVNLPVLDLLRALPSSARVLDVGCGRATLAGEARKHGLSVFGIENHPEACAVAEARVDRLLRVDLQDVDAVARSLGDTRFDAIVFSDVLEHVPWPDQVLRAYLPFLTPGGQVIVSLPNVAVWTVRAQIAAGNFDYEDTGVLDRTHLRFFTVATAKKLLEDAGLEVDTVTGDPMLVRSALPLIKSLLGGGGGESRGILDSPAYRLYVRAVLPIERVLARAWRGGLWFRIVLRARIPG